MFGNVHFGCDLPMFGTIFWMQFWGENPFEVEAISGSFHVGNVVFILKINKNHFCVWIYLNINYITFNLLLTDINSFKINFCHSKIKHTLSIFGPLLKTNKVSYLQIRSYLVVVLSNGEILYDIN